MLTLHVLTVVRLLQHFHESKALGNDGKLVPFCMRSIEMRLDLLHVACRGHAFHLVNVSTVVQQGWCQHNKARVGLEVKGVHLVETQEGHKEANVRTKAFDFITMDGYLTRKTLKRVRELLESPERREKMVNTNFEIAEKYYSFERLRRWLHLLLINFFGSEV